MKRQVIILAVFWVGIYLVGCTPPPTPRQLELTSPVPTPVPLPTATNRWPSRHTPQPSNRPSGDGSKCTVDEYKAEAKKQMSRVGELVDSIEFESDTSVRSGLRSIPGILQSVRGMHCARSYPLKQETLEYTAIHLGNALDSRLAGDLISSNESIDNALLNSERFKNWAVDMD